MEHAKINHVYVTKATSVQIVARKNVRIIVQITGCVMKRKENVFVNHFISEVNVKTKIAQKYA